MPNYQSGPVNIQQGNTASFVVEYFDSAGVLTTPVSATISVEYANTAGATVTDVVTLTQNNSFFTGSWSSSGAALGLATWSVDATAGSTSGATGQLRIIDRQG